MGIRVIVLIDSRGNTLQDKVDKLLKDYNRPDIIIIILPRSGAKLTDLYTLLRRHINAGHSYDYGILASGVNHLSVKLSSWKIEPIFYSVDTLESTLITAYKNFTVNALVDFNLPITVAPLVGLSYKAWNESHSRYAPYLPSQAYPIQQAVVNDGMVKLDTSVAELNRQFNITPPHLFSTVHKKNGNVYYHKYGKLRDGVHPNPTLEELWASKIVTSVLNTIK